MSISCSCRVTDTSIMAPMPRPRRSPVRKSCKDFLRYSGRCPASRALSPWPEKSALWQLSQWRDVRSAVTFVRIDVGFAW